MFAYSSRAALIGAFVVALAATSFAVCPNACPHACKGEARGVPLPVVDTAATTDTQVAMEIRFITISPELVESLGLEKPPEAGETAVCFLDDTQYRVLREKVQDDPRANVMQAPKITAIDGQEAKLDIREEQPFVTGVDLGEVDGRKMFLPRVQTLSSGVKIDAQPFVSADRRFVKLRLGVELSHIDERVPTYPVFCALGQAAGKDGKIEPFFLTQHLQQPHRTVIRIDKSLVIPDGKSAVLTSCTMEREVRTEFGPPVLSRIPYVNRLFKNVGYTKQAEHLLVVVTPRIIVQQEQEEKVVAAPRQEAAGEEASEPVAEKMPSAPIPTLYVKDKKFRLTYEVDNVGSSAIKQVEVWWTKDGNAWARYADEVKPTGKVVIDVKDDGTYGFRLNARSGAGLAAPAPQGTDAPHTWVVVDTMAPAVKMEPVKVENTNGGEVVFQWAVTDTHLEAKPVKIRYAEKPEGPWIELVAGKPSAGTYRHPVKKLPTVAYFRIDATDKSGNVGTAWTTEPVQIDLKVPVIRNVIGNPVP